MQETSSLMALAVEAFGLALASGFLATLLRLPPLVGYLVAGMLLGPNGLALVTDIRLAHDATELGLVLLLFGTGLHFSLEDFWAVRKTVVPGALAQIILTGLLSTGFGLMLGWRNQEALMLAGCITVASTVVLTRALESRGELRSSVGQLAMGWLVVEDVAVIFLLVSLPSVATFATSGTTVSGGAMIWLLADLGFTLLKVAAFILLMFLVGRRLLPKILWFIAQTGSSELFRLAVIAIAILTAYASYRLFGVSLTLGAFFAGVLLGESEFSQRATEDSMPLRDAMALAFFVGMGMLVDPTIILEHPMPFVGLVGIIVFGKSLWSSGLLLALGHPLKTALVLGIGMGQIGEFSFVLAHMGVTLNCLQADQASLVTLSAITSIVLNSLLVRQAPWARDALVHQWQWARRLDLRTDPLAALPYTTSSEFLSDQMVLIGYGRVGKRVAQALWDQEIPTVIVDQNREKVDHLRRQGRAAVSGDATTPEVLIQAHVTKAAVVILTLPNPLHILQIVPIVRELNPRVTLIARTLTEEEANLLKGQDFGRIFHPLEELARSMTLEALSVLPYSKNK